MDRGLELKGIVRTTHALAALRCAFLWNGHDFT
jgi:hypothetical protein